MSKQPLIDQLDQAVTQVLANIDVMDSSVDAALASMLQLARDLRDLPSPGFKARLRTDLERKLSMATKPVHFRQGFHTVTPYIVVPAAAELIAFVKDVFGAEETLRVESGPGAIHAEVRLGDSMMMIGGGSGYSGPSRHATIHVYVENSDEAYQRALNAGADSTLEMTEGHGERFGCVRDPFGISWIIARPLDARTLEGRHTVTPFMYAEDAARFIDFMKQAFGAEQLLRADSPDGRVKHARLRIGDSVVATGELHEGQTLLPAMLYLYVPDADAVFEQAIRAGAQSIHAPVNQPYGDRNGGVTDAWGNQWYMATPL